MLDPLDSVTFKHDDFPWMPYENVLVLFKKKKNEFGNSKVERPFSCSWIRRPTFFWIVPISVTSCDSYAKHWLGEAGWRGHGTSLNISLPFLWIYNDLRIKDFSKEQAVNKTNASWGKKDFAFPPLSAAIC